MIHVRTSYLMFLTNEQREQDFVKGPLRKLMGCGNLVPGVGSAPTSGGSAGLTREQFNRVAAECRRHGRPIAIRTRVPSDPAPPEECSGELLQQIRDWHSDGIEEVSRWAFAEEVEVGAYLFEEPKHRPAWLYSSVPDDTTKEGQDALNDRRRILSKMDAWHDRAIRNAFPRVQIVRYNPEVINSPGCVRRMGGEAPLHAYYPTDLNQEAGLWNRVRHYGRQLKAVFAMHGRLKAWQSGHTEPVLDGRLIGLERLRGRMLRDSGCCIHVAFSSHHTDTQRAALGEFLRAFHKED